MTRLKIRGGGVLCCLILALSMILTPMGVFADTAEVPLLLTVEPEPLDFTVTESVQMHAYQGDSNLTISPVTVTNTGSEDLKVSQIEITTETGWSLAAADTDFTTAESKNKLAFTLGSHDFSTGAYAIGETLSAGGSNSYQLTGKLSEKADLTNSSKVSSFVVTVEKKVSLITFSLADNNSQSNIINSYQAEEGMTWESFINSNYNNGDFSIDGKTVKCEISSSSPFAPTQEIQQISNIIRDGATYYCATFGYVLYGN